MATICTSNALADLDAIHTELNAAMDILYTIQEAMHHGCNSIEDYASAVWGLWSYMTDLVDRMGKRTENALNQRVVEA